MWKYNDFIFLHECVQLYLSICFMYFISCVKFGNTEALNSDFIKVLNIGLTWMMNTFTSIVSPLITSLRPFTFFSEVRISCYVLPVPQNPLPHYVNILPWSFHFFCVTDWGKTDTSHSMGRASAFISYGGYFQEAIYLKHQCLSMFYWHIQKQGCSSVEWCLLSRASALWM